MGLYPDYEAATAACAARLRVGPDQVLLTNGLDEGILAASVATLRGAPAEAPFEAIVIVPAFDMYAACAEAAGGRVVEVPQDRDFVFPLDQVLNAIGSRTRLVWLTNPNNPTGQIIARDVILQIAGAAPQALVAVDEAYADFSGQTLLDGHVLDRLPNVIVGRTFSKAYGLAGLRAGALVAAPETLAPLRRIVPPYSINVCAAAALPAALGDTAYYAWYLDEVQRSKALMYAAFDRLDIAYWKSAANFVLAHFGGHAGQVVGALAARRIFVRDRSGEIGCAGCVRMTAGIVTDTRALLEALEGVL
jgi:histidinol-phosphate aminotransferase